ncbi:hypothetical protein [Spiroplasma endosymbiont of Virgichneumon dumeticola]|uniref:hypothetical protein n=1 Tax=Spiroplasma endosymbiont of Virgichneumon dumeticola TaxID=3139323 RepID=UPI0035C89D75
MNKIDLEKLETKKPVFFPYEKKIKKAYFAYLGVCAIPFIWSFIFSLFATINVAKYQLYNLSLTDFKYNILNLLYNPALFLFLLIVSMLLLTFAPKVSNISSKYSNRMFYIAFWFLILSTMLSSEVQWTYISQSEILWGSHYNWINPILALIFIIISIFSILVVQVYFWIMRRKFTFINSYYEIYTNRSMMKQNYKIKKQELIREKKQKKFLLKVNKK